VGCNAFDKTRPSSQPLSFWTKSDIFRAIKQFNIPYCKEVYGEIIEKDGVFTPMGACRSGCACCLVGIHLDHPNKLQTLRETHPKLHDYYINRLGMGDLLDRIGVDYGGR
jgi:3'-phosphoadenosine 5'-phosphosulfate sulfotransferase (PAPS reductase)/FAD synthetase